MAGLIEVVFIAIMTSAATVKIIGPQFQNRLIARLRVDRGNNPASNAYYVIQCFSNSREATSCAGAILNQLIFSADVTLVYPVNNSFIHNC